MGGLSPKRQKLLIFGITLGGILEWYDLFLFFYWGPLLSTIFFPHESELDAVFRLFFIFGLTFISRPLGGMLFGYLGDRYGRRFSFLASIVTISITTVCTAALPTYHQIGLISPILLTFFKFLQGFPAGGELPGAICYLFESANKDNRRYLSSWSFFGPQLGAFFGISEYLLVKFLLTPEQLLSWGWRISFLAGGVLGLTSLFIRSVLQETPQFRAYKETLDGVHIPKAHLFKKHKALLLKGFLLPSLNVVGFYLICIFSAFSLDYFFEIRYTTNLAITACLTLLATLPLPLYGYLATIWDYRKMLIISSLAVILLSYPLHLALSALSLPLTLSCFFLLILFLNVQFALIPSVLAEQFPTSIRYSGLGFSFNLCDSLLGGLAPVVALYIILKAKNDASFVWLLAGAAIMSLLSLLFVERNHLRRRRESS